MKNLIFIFYFFCSFFSQAQKLHNTNFYYQNNKIHFQTSFHSKFDISQCLYLTHFQILNDSTYVAELRVNFTDLYKLNMSYPKEFKYPVYARVTFCVLPRKYSVLVDNIFWDVDMLGTTNIEQIFIHKTKIRNKKYLKILNNWFLNMFD